MITASHNPVADNGVKLVDPAGEMLAATWEVHATTLVNAPDDSIDTALTEIANKAGIDLGKKAVVIVGRDTRWDPKLKYVVAVLCYFLFTIPCYLLTSTCACFLWCQFWFRNSTHIMVFMKSDCDFIT